MSSVLYSLLSYLPLDFQSYLHWGRTFLVSKWYHFFPTSSRHVCRLCKETLQKKSEGQHQMAFLEASELSGQEQFETYGQVNCPHHKSVQSLRSSAEENCMICSRVWLSVGENPEQREVLFDAIDVGAGHLTYCRIVEASQVSIDLHQRGGDNCLLASVGIPERIFPNTPQPVTFILLPTDEMNSSIHWRLPSYGTNSALSWYTARFWYTSCLEAHESCNRKRLEQSEGRQWYPTRLVKLSRWSNKLRLVVTETERLDAPYLTLSHCWGKADFIQLTQSSMSDFLRDIPHQRLPKTFQDAICIARSLGIFYIWIDSLCIIQREESLVDWKLEAPQMDKVYSHAVLNIAATGASDSSKGLFFPRRSDALGEIRLDWSFKSKFSHQYAIIDYNYWKHLVVDEPLIRRAWVVQERLLAPRVLHFGSRQLFWECSGLEASEDFPVGIPPVLIRSDQDSLYKFFDEIVLQVVDSNHPSPAHAVWQRALSSYTHASLTKSEDKLIAIAGIARELSSNLSSDYIAGLWKEYMATELLWFVDTDTVSKRQNYRAPSFSWASVDGAVIPGQWQQNDILVEVQDAFASTEISNPFSSVESAFVRVRGVLKRAMLCQNHLREEYASRYPTRAPLPIEKRYRGIGTSHRESMIEKQRFHLCLKDIYAPSNIKPSWMIMRQEVYYGQTTAPEIVEDSWWLWGTDIYLDEDDCSSERYKSVYLMVVVGQSAYCTAVRGLILEPTRRVEGEYRRLGLFITYHGDSMNILGVPHRSEDKIPCEAFDPEKHEHTIVLV